jgi:hypothetical protein
VLQHTAANVLMAENVTTVDTIRDLKNREPFSPFSIVMASGDRYLIDDPDALAIGRDQVFYYPPRSGAGVHMQLFQIAVVEENGVKRRVRRK